MKFGVFLSFAFFLIVPQIALSYIGPGGGLSAIGALLALVLAVVVAIFGFVWYPIKRWLSSNNDDVELEEGVEGNTDDSGRGAR